MTITLSTNQPAPVREGRCSCHRLAEARELETWGQGVFARANQIPWPASGSRKIAKAVTDLYCAVSRCGRILNHENDPGSAFPELKGSSGGLDEALCKVAEDVRADAGYLVEVIGTYCGTEAAAHVNGLPG